MTLAAEKIQGPLMSKLIWKYENCITVNFWFSKASRIPGGATPGTTEI